VVVLLAVLLEPRSRVEDVPDEDDVELDVAELPRRHGPAVDARPEAGSLAEVAFVLHGLTLDGVLPGSPEGVLPSTHDAVCNGALVLTEYTLDDGAIAMVPGSHRLFRVPAPGQGEKRAVPVEAPVGSLIFWHGNTWHGAFPKKTEGLRLNLTTYFCHRSLKTQESYQGAVPAEMLARHGEKFARLLGADDPYGWDENGPDFRSAVRYLERTQDAS